jgi:DNA-binding transcriptional ArsR family regulator
MSRREEEKRRLDQVDSVLKALGHETRRHILLNLKFRGGSMTAGDIAARYSCKWPTVSRHLKVLVESGLITVEREGRNMLYRLNRVPLEEMTQDFLSYFQDHKP